MITKTQALEIAVYLADLNVAEINFITAIFEELDEITPSIQTALLERLIVFKSSFGDWCNRPHLITGEIVKFDEVRLTLAGVARYGESSEEIFVEILKEVK